MLKTLEEPPADTFLILVTSHEDRLLATIRSRCHRVTFSPIAPDIVGDFIDGFVSRQAGKKSKLKADQRQWLIEFSAGSPGRALLALEYDLYQWGRMVSPALEAMTHGKFSTEFGKQMLEFINEFAERWVKNHANASKDAANKQAAALMWSLIAQHAMRQISQKAVELGSEDPLVIELSLEPWLSVIETLGGIERELASNVNMGLVCDHLASLLYRTLSPAGSTGSTRSAGPSGDHGDRSPLTSTHGGNVLFDLIPWYWLLIYNLLKWAVLLGMVAVILRRQFPPSTSLAWLMLIFLHPLVGLGLYILLGDNRLGKKRIRQHREVIEKLRANQPRVNPSSPSMTEDENRPVMLQAQRIGGMPILEGNEVELLPDNSQFIERLIEDIDRAQNHIHLLYYIFEPDVAGQRVVEALIRASKRDVKCRVLADDVGSRHLFRRRKLYRQMLENQIDVRPVLSVSFLRRGLSRLDLRNHRKLAVFDGAVAYAGSANVVADGCGPKRPGTGAWIDLSARFTGPVVAQLQVVFLEDWFFETEESLDTEDIHPAVEAVGDVPVQSVATGPSNESQAFPRVLLAAINHAHQKVVITTPYFIPDEPTVWALQMAAERGVDVQIVIPRRSDHLLVDVAGRAYFQSMLDAGVKIFHYEPGVLHSKTMTVDNDFSLIGSSNMDVRSFYLNFELNVLLYGPMITRQLQDLQSQYIADSVPLDAEVWRKRSLMRRYLGHAAALLSPLL